MRKLTTPSLILFLASTISGCASMFSGESQTIHLTQSPKSAAEPNVAPEQQITSCLLQNGRGSWHAAPGDYVSLRRDGQALAISCYNNQQLLVAHTSVPPHYNTTNLWNIPLTLIPTAGIAGWVLDGTNGTSNEYPSTITLTAKAQNAKAESAPNPSSSNETGE